MTFVENCMRAPIRERRRIEREERQARVQRGECPAMSPVRRLSPAEIAAYEAELLAREAGRLDLETLARLPARIESMPNANSDRALLLIADELEERAHRIRAQVGAVPVAVEVQPAAPKAKERPKRKTKPAPKPKRPVVTDRSRILAAFGPFAIHIDTVVRKFRRIPKATVTGHVRALVAQRKVERVERGLYRRVAP